MTEVKHFSTLFQTMLTISLTLPLLAAVVALIISERYSWVVSFVSTFLLFVTTVAAAYVSYSVWNGSPFMLKTSWFSIGGINVTAGVYLENHAALMLAVV